jgi:adenylate cyclase
MENLFDSLGHRLMKLVRISILFYLLCSPGMQAQAQFPEADSLRHLLTTRVPDTQRVKIMNALSKTLFSDRPDSSVHIAERTRVLAEAIEYRPGLALALKHMGIGYYLQGNYLEAVRTWREAMAVFKEIGDKTGEANILSNMGAAYFNQGDEANSLDLHLQSLKISEEINDTLRIVTSLNNIGGIYQNKTSQHDKALDYFLRSYNLNLSRSEPDQYLLGTALVNLGELYYKKGNDTAALRYLNESAKAYEGTESLPYALIYIGRVYTRQQKFDKAIETLTNAFEYAKKLDTRLDMAQALVGLAQTYYAKGDVKTAISSYKQSLEFSVPMNTTMEMKDAYQGLTDAYAKNNDYGNAFKYQNLLLAIKDTIYNVTTDKKLGTLQFTFDLERKESQISLLNKNKVIQQQEINRQKMVRNSFIGGFAVVLLFAAIFFKQRNKISKGKKRSDELLLNILPEETAEELKETGTAKAKRFEQISVLFTDFKNFTQASENLTPEELVAEINHCYSEFDRIITRYGIEKIKTIGDSYMCAGGLPVSNETHPFDVVNAALEIAAFIDTIKQERIKEGKPAFDIRIGIHTGPVVAGIVGIKKFSYDIWGDTVNTASRMESSGAIGKVNISSSTYELVKDKFICTPRGKLEAKGKGLIEMYFVEGPRVGEVQREERREAISVQ